MCCGGPWTDPRSEPRPCIILFQARLPLTVTSAVPAPSSLSRQSFPAAQPLPSPSVRVPQISTSPASQPWSPQLQTSIHLTGPIQLLPQPPPQAEFQLGCTWGPNLHCPSRIEGLVILSGGTADDAIASTPPGSAARPHLPLSLLSGAQAAP